MIVSSWSRIAALALLGLIASPVPAGESEKIPSPYTPGPVYHASADCPKEKWSFEVLGGAYLLTSLGPSLPEFDYATFDLRLGCRPLQDGCDGLRDRVQVLLDGMYAHVYNGFGDYVAGASLLLRLDLLGRGCAVIPYAQIGAGVVHTDAADDKSQGAIGQSVEFLLQAQLGARVRLCDRFSLLVEGGMQHISNAGLGERNGGTNSAGGSAGLEWRFR